MKKQIIALSLIIFSGFQAAQASKSSLDSVQLDPVPLDTSLQCNRLLFRSASQHQGTVFLVPRVFPTKNSDGKAQISIIKSNRQDEFKYQLAISLYFPMEQETLSIISADGQLQKSKPCDWDYIKYVLNKDVSPGNEKVQNISPIPLTSIEMIIPGIKNKGIVGKYLNDGRDSDILDYYGKTLSVYFDISEEEKAYFLSKTLGIDGLSSSIRMKFKAHGRSGSVTARVKKDDLMRSIEAQIETSKLQKLSSAKIKALLSQTLNSTTIEIDATVSDNDNSMKIIKEVTDKVTTDVMQLFKLNDSSKKESSFEKSDIEKPSDGGLIAAEVFLKALQNKMNMSYSFNMIAATEEAMAQSEIFIKTDRLNDSNILNVKLTIGEGAKYLGLNIKPGETIFINPGYWYFEQLKMERNSKYLTRNELNYLIKDQMQFSKISNSHYIIDDVEVNGHFFAQGKYVLTTLKSEPSLYKYNWVRQEVDMSNWVRVESNQFGSNLDAYLSIPVSFSFTELGERKVFKIKDLLNDNDFFSGFYDEIGGRIVLTAKQNLGDIRVTEYMLSQDKDKLKKNLINENQISRIVNNGITLNKDRVLELETDPMGFTRQIGELVLSSVQNPVVKRKTVGFSMTRPKNISLNEIRSLRNKNSQLQSLKISDNP